MRNIKLILEYDGSAYHGWQRQTNALTVQEVLEAALGKITGEQVSVTGCGRTDAGVHARAYVCNFKTAAAIPPDRVAYALNSVLPEDIICKESAEAAQDFDSKRSAVSKRYTYLICNSEFPDVFMRNRAWHCKYPLDIEKMRLAAQCFVGEHDFIGFAASGFSVKTTVRTIYSACVEEENNIISIDVCGNGFLYNMVRIIAGTLMFCGCGRIDWREVTDIIASRDRTRAGITAPPCGLYLSEVTYR